MGRSAIEYELIFYRTQLALACDLAYIRDPEGRMAHVDYVLSNSFGFGGINACLVFGRI